jgi:hypothetical protein
MVGGRRMEDWQPIEPNEPNSFLVSIWQNEKIHAKDLYGYNLLKGLSTSNVQEADMRPFVESILGACSTISFLVQTLQRAAPSSCPRHRLGRHFVKRPAMRTTKTVRVMG